jgi:hypothetical protein
MLHVCYLCRHAIDVIIKGNERIAKVCVLIRIRILASTFHSKKTPDNEFTIIYSGQSPRFETPSFFKHRHFYVLISVVQLRRLSAFLTV